MPRRRKPPRPGALGELPPLRIASQIAALQGLYYAGALVLMLFTALVAGTRFSMELVFGWEAVRGDTTQGWLSAFVWVLDGGLCMAVAIIVLIGRSKLVPDFALTMHGLHLVVSSLYTGRVPRNMMWLALGGILVYNAPDNVAGRGFQQEVCNIPKMSING
ncbi:Protein SYS1 [Colletotrichum fructicola]|nr:Protein SYS1 [Colletotrichum fructicola]